MISAIVGGLFVGCVGVGEGEGGVGVHLVVLLLVSCR